MKNSITKKNLLQDTFEKISKCLDPSSRDFFEVVIHVVLAINKKTDEIMGGIVFEFYNLSSFGLISYICVDPKYRQYKIGRNLIELAEDQLNNRSLQNSGKSCEAILLEISSPMRLKDEEKDHSFSAEQKISVFRKIGCDLVEIDYIQPPLDNVFLPDDSLLLICINKEKKTHDGNKLADFFFEFWETSCEDSSPFKEYLLRSISDSKEKRWIPLSPLNLENIGQFESQRKKRITFKSNL